MTATDIGFVDRVEYLELLTERYDREKPDLLIIYGRRRLGKSELVRQSIADHDDAVYWQAEKGTPHAQRTEFVDAASDIYPFVEDIRPEWDPLLRNLGRENAIIAIDEFPYLIAADDTLPSVFQRIWDQYLSDTEMTLVLIGSSISVMENEVLAGDSPLYGRRTATIDLPPLALGDAKRFYPANNPDEVFQSWSIFGGTPYYLEELDPDQSLSENVQRVVLSEHGNLNNEPELLLLMELDEPQTYYSLLQALAHGKRSTNEIAQFAGISSTNASPYLRKLRRLRLITRDIPITANPRSTKKSRYRLNDPFFRFWFRFVYGQQDRIAMLGEDAYDRLVASELTDYLDPLFEIACQKALPKLVPHPYRGVGYWWYSNHELDVVGLTDEGTLIAGECKYTTRKMTEGDLAAVENTAVQIDWTPPGGGTPNYEYCCFCRSGFSDDLTEIMRERSDVHLFTPDDIVAALTSESGE
jgi:AAA+ ATPase superfamily predicted ATPase